MSAETHTPCDRRDGGFQHEALLYAGTDEFVDAVGGFLLEAVAADEPVMAAVSAEKAARLRDAMGADADAVVFADMLELGRNPSRILPAWREFVDDHTADGRGLRGVGEPVWPGRTGAELEECFMHEALLNSAFADAADFWLVCPYDASELAPDVIEGAGATHPFMLADGRRVGSDVYETPSATLEADLPEPEGVREKVDFLDGDLGAVRSLVSGHAAGLGLDPGRAEDLVLAVNEIATNSLQHGGGQGLLRIWDEGRALVCEVRDDGRVRDPLTGRRRPSDHARGGRGLWMAHHLCDLVQLRSSDEGTTVRLHMRLDAVPSGQASWIRALGFAH